MLGFALDGMMTLRIHALYGRSYRVFAPLGICYAFEQVANVLQLSVVNPGITATAQKFVGSQVDEDACILWPSHFYVSLYVAAISASIVYHSLLLAMSCYSFFRHMQEQGKSLLETWRICGLYMFVVRQHLLYFVLATLTSAIGLVSFYFAPAEIAYKSPMGGTTLNVLQRVSDVVQLCMIGPHMMLSIREHNDKLERGGSHNGTEMLTSIRFASQQPHSTLCDDTI